MDKIHVCFETSDDRLWVFVYADGIQVASGSSLDNETDIECVKRIVEDALLQDGW